MTLDNKKERFSERYAKEIILRGIYFKKLRTYIVFS